MKYCKNCGKELTTEQRHNVYCSTACQSQYQRNEYIKRWKNGEEDGLNGKYGLSLHIKKYLIEKANYKCEKCGWGEKNIFTGNIPLQIHHIDSDYSNNTESNLQVLCPNCHALTENFGSRGKGRSARQKYYKQGTCVDCGAIISTTAQRCSSCEQKRRTQEFLNNLPVSRDELKQRIRVESFTQIGKDYNITANGLKRWIAKYGLPNTKTEIKKYTDEEWEKI